MRQCTPKTSTCFYLLSVVCMHVHVCMHVDQNTHVCAVCLPGFQNAQNLTYDKLPSVYQDADFCIPVPGLRHSDARITASRCPDYGIPMPGLRHPDAGITASRCRDYGIPMPGLRHPDARNTASQYSCVRCNRNHAVAIMLSQAMGYRFAISVLLHKEP